MQPDALHAPRPNKVVLPPAVELSNATLEVLELIPKPGSVLGRETIIHARIRYEVEMRPNTTYRLASQFQTTEEHVTFDGSAPVGFSTALKTAAGVVTVAFPMSYVYDDLRLANPIRVEFLLLQYFRPNRAISRARSDFFEYRR